MDVSFCRMVVTFFFSGGLSHQVVACFVGENDGTLFTHIVPSVFCSLMPPQREEPGPTVKGGDFNSYLGGLAPGDSVDSLGCWGLVPGMLVASN